MITITATTGCSVQRGADEHTDFMKYETLYFTDQPVRKSPEWVIKRIGIVIVLRKRASKTNK